ncbi:MAG: methyltransferase domain-containing protein [Myxococcota bacterium]|jgi:23S rRNA (uracil1939-C5)-methyltransferase|nr:methyltransferase domain-containing protein [Myxococcota bacterium]
MSSSVTVERISDLTARAYGRSESGLLVPNGLPGELLRVRSSSERRWRRLGQVVELLEASPQRADAECAQAWDCPGCCFRCVPIETEQAWKRELLLRPFRRKGLELDPLLAPMVLPSHVEGYRIRCTAQAFVEDGHLLWGMRGFPWAARPIDLSRCPAQNGATRAGLHSLAAQLDGLEVFDLERGVDGLRWLNLHADESVSTPARAVLIFSSAEAARRARPQLEAVRGFSLGVGVTPASSHKVFRADPEWIHGDSYAAFRAPGLGDLELLAAPQSWTPVAAANVHLVLSTLLSCLEDWDGVELLELGCGVGTLSLALAQRGARVWGVDLERRSVDSASLNARHLQLCEAQARFFQGEALKSVRRLLAKGRRFDVVILHAMRGGYGAECLRLIRLLGAGRVFLIYPTAASLARELAELGLDGVFAMRRLHAFNQLPRSSATMVCAELSVG